MLFKNLYVNGKEYTDEEFGKNVNLQLPVLYTLEIFHVEEYKSVENQEKIAPSILKILMSAPNEAFKRKFREFASLNKEN